MPDSVQSRLARLDERVTTLATTSAQILDELRSASDGRKRMYEAQEATSREILTLTHRITNLERDVLEIAPVSKAHARMLEQAKGAGTAGRWAMWIGGHVVTAIASATALYTWLTGRPPP